MDELVLEDEGSKPEGIMDDEVKRAKGASAWLYNLGGLYKFGAKHPY